MENLESREKAFLKTINTGGEKIKNLTSDGNFYSLIFFTPNFFNVPSTSSFQIQGI